MKIKNEHRQWQHIGPLYHHSLWDAKVIIKVLFWKTYFLIMLLTPRLVRFLLLYLVESSPLAPLCMHPGWAQIHDGGPLLVGTSRDSHVCCYKTTVHYYILFIYYYFKVTWQHCGRAPPCWRCPWCRGWCGCSPGCPASCPPPPRSAPWPPLAMCMSRCCCQCLKQ